MLRSVQTTKRAGNCHRMCANAKPHNRLLTHADAGTVTKSGPGVINLDFSSLSVARRGDDAGPEAVAATPRTVARVAPGEAPAAAVSGSGLRCTKGTCRPRARLSRPDASLRTDGCSNRRCRPAMRAMADRDIDADSATRAPCDRLRLRSVRLRRHGLNKRERL